MTVNPVNDDAPVLAPIGNKTGVKGTALSFTAIATEPDAGQTKTFSLVNAPVGATINSTSGYFSWTPGATGTYTLIVKVADNGSPILSDEEQITITVTNPTLSTVRLNSGGPAITTDLGSFAADAYMTGTTSTYTNAVAIDGSTADVLYQTFRKAATAGTSFGYNIPVTNGTYTVKLHFAEIYHTAAGQRKFNVTAEGAAWLTNYDIITAAGAAKKAVVATKNVPVADGQLSLTFASVVDGACVAAIEVVPAVAVATIITFSSISSPAVETPMFTSRLYPNPATDQIAIDLKAPIKEFTTSITDASGVVVLKDNHQVLAADKLGINIAHLKNGLYQLHLQTSAGIEIFRFVKK